MSGSGAALVTVHSGPAVIMSITATGGSTAALVKVCTNSGAANVLHAFGVAAATVARKGNPVFLHFGDTNGIIAPKKLYVSRTGGKKSVITFRFIKRHRSTTL